MQLRTLLLAGLAALAVSAESVTTFKQYIVVFKDATVQTQMDQVANKIKEWGGKVLHEFSIINAISAEIPAALAHGLTAFAQVDYVEEDGEVKINRNNNQDFL
ncbi:UNVERIFIED_CONTAM: hypothetical protein HDU68_009182 [Siphonaria sp. JEL0065]|nr:hypothetical protein HDU68_009182 [Siphonaria sp. JEL0065]